MVRSWSALGETKFKLGRIVSLIGGIVAVISAMLPWATRSQVPVRDWSIFDLDLGLGVLGMFLRYLVPILVISGGLLSLLSLRWRLGAVGGIGPVVASLAFASLLSSTYGRTDLPVPGIGLWLALLGGVVSLSGLLAREDDVSRASNSSFEATNEGR